MNIYPAKGYSATLKLKRPDQASVVSMIVTLVTQMVHASAEPVTRDAVHARAAREFSRREWTKVDDMLGMASFTYKVGFATGPQNKRLYVKLT